MKNQKPFSPKRSAEPEKPVAPKDFNTRTQQLCRLLEDRITSGDLRLTFADYLRLLQWRESKGFDRPAATVVTWADPWWLGKIGEMQADPVIKAVLDKFKADGTPKDSPPSKVDPK